MMCAASSSRAPGATSRGTSARRRCLSQAATLQSCGVPTARACNAQRGVMRPCAPRSSTTNAAFWPEASNLERALWMVSLGLHVGTTSSGFMIMPAVVCFAKVRATSRSEQSPQRPLATSRAEKTPTHGPSKRFTTKWWYVFPGSAALSISPAASMSSMAGGTTSCGGIVGCCVAGLGSHWPTVLVRSLPSRKACMRSVSVSKPIGESPSLSPSTVAEVLPEVARSRATSPSVSLRLQTVVRCQSCPRSSPTEGPAQRGLEFSSNECALVHRTRSKDDKTPTASMLPDRTTTRWSRPLAVMRAAASASGASAATRHASTLPGCSRSQSPMQTLLGTPPAKACTASRGVTMPYMPSSSTMSALFCCVIRRTLSTSFMVLVGGHVNTVSRSFMTSCTVAAGSPGSRPSMPM
mmetsp:Transcript_95305/g.264903  ORF Transcript_95305/g.264903 Transcript_95305/m.264903 type:complete len:409 (+) Transcript_95305:712-1938(+)